jgi:farnesyl-diphosphate farnesyltransferase
VDWPLLRAVSRSFYLTLRLLPSAVREPIALAYLLARLTDTEADGAVTDAERDLVTRRADLERALAAAPDRDLIGAVWQTIQDGQEFDRRRFVPGAAPLTPDELDRYTYLVAGCVGDFWTKICARHLPGFAREPEPVMTDRGIAYGQGLQLVNILRDRAADRKLGRIYVPDERLAETLALARRHLGEAADYVHALRSRRLRAATALPLLLARETLELVEAHPDAERVKVPRHRVWWLLGRALTSL